jgi:hypothetical protein
MNPVLEEILVLKGILNENDHQKMVKKLATEINFFAMEVIDTSSESELKNALEEVEDNVDHWATIFIEEYLPSNFDQEEMRKVDEIRDAATKLAYLHFRDEIEENLEWLK